MQSGRAAFRFLFSENVELNLIGDITEQRQKGPGDKYTIIDGTNGLNGFWGAVFASPVFGAGMSYDDRFVTNSLYTNYSRYDDPLEHRLVPNINNLEHWGVSATLEWKLSDAVSLKSITAYRDWWNNFGRDSDGTPLPNNATYDESKHRQFTQEIQLTGTGGKLDWAAGAFYYDAHDSNQGFDFLYPTIIYQNDAFDRQDTTNWAVFAQGTFHATDQLSFTLGGRYTDDQKDATIYRANFFGGIVIDNAFVPTVDDQHGLHRRDRLSVGARLHDLRQVRDRVQGRWLQPTPVYPAADRSVRRRNTSRPLRSAQKRNSRNGACA